MENISSSLVVATSSGLLHLFLANEEGSLLRVGAVEHLILGYRGLKDIGQVIGWAVLLGCIIEIDIYVVKVGELRRCQGRCCSIHT